MSNMKYYRQLCFVGVLLLNLIQSLPAQEDSELSSRKSNWIYINTDEIESFSINRLILLSEDDAWWGGRIKATDTGNAIQTPLYRYKNNKWSYVSDFPITTDRTFEFSAYDENNLIIIAYRDTSYQNSLDIWHYNGQEWSMEVARPGIFPQASAMVSPDEIWIVGNHGRMLHKKDGRWMYKPLSQDTAAMSHVNLMQISMQSPEYGWVVGKRGIAARYDGHKWNIIQLPDDIRDTGVTNVDITSSGAAWFVGENGLILKYHNGIWTRFPRVVNSNLMSISMLNDTNGWAVGFYGAILQYNGKSWKQLNSIRGAERFASVKAINDSTGWIAAKGTLLKLSKSRTHPFKIGNSRSEVEVDNLKGHSVIMADLDRDLDNDILVISNSKILEYINNGSGVFSQSTAGVATEVSQNLDRTISVGVGDIDHDATIDIIALRNGGLGSISIQNVNSRYHLQSIIPAQSIYDDRVYLLDVDLDGDLDYYHLRSISSKYQHVTNKLYTNNGFGQFTITDSTTGDYGSGRISLWGDLNGDMYPDLIIPESISSLSCYVNNGNGTFRDHTLQSGLANTMEGYIRQALLEDIDIDGDLDLIAIGTQIYVWHNDGDFHFTPAKGVFSDSTGNLASSTPHGITSGDVNNDGYPDLLIRLFQKDGPTSRFFLSDSTGRYEDISETIGFTNVRENTLLMDDRDNDGDLDLYIFQPYENSSQYFSNEINDKNYLKITPRGTKANRMGIGSEIRIYESGYLHNPDYLRGYRQHALGKNPAMPNQISTSHFGLNADKTYDVQVRFPGGRTVIKRNIRAAQHLEIHEYPAGVRHAYLSWRALLLAFVRANPLIEIGKLILLSSLVLALIITFRRKEFSYRLLSKWYIWLLFGILYLLLNSFFVIEKNLLKHLALVGGPFTILAIVAYTDSYYIFWRESNYIGHYRLLSRIGEGGMGIVHKAYDVNKRRTCALKVLHPIMLDNEKNRIRFLREAKIMESLEHSNIVKIYETGEIGGRGYINMELLEGITLRDLVSQSGPLSSGIIIPIIMQICDALEYMHQKQIIHRDIKSDNIFLVTKQTRNLQSRITNSLRGSSSEKSLIKTKLMDFGLARSMQMMSLTKMEAIVGTLAYMSPEQAIAKNIDQRSDIYSLGVVMYEGLTGEFPFSGEHEVAMLQSIIANKQIRPIHELRPDIIPELESLVLKMLKYDPAERFQSATELKKKLAEIPITLEKTFVSRSVKTNQSALDFSQKSISLLEAGNQQEALELSEKAVSKLERQKHFSQNSGQIYLNHFKILNASGLNEKAQSFLERAHQSVIMKKVSQTAAQSVALAPNPLDRQIVITYETNKWQELYKKAKMLESKSKISDARNALLECAGILTQVFMLFDNETDKETYIEEYKVETVLKFMKKFDL